MMWKNKRWNILTRIIKANDYFVVAEIGVADGVIASYLLKNCFLKSYVGVDNYSVNEAISKPVAETLFNSHDQASLLIEDSVDASNRFPDAFFDLVFIDGDPSYAGCSRDLIAWLPKVRDGGFLLGSNYDPFLFPDVVIAVNEILGQKNISLFKDHVWAFRVGKETNQ